jgi:hypothetical protein
LGHFFISMKKNIIYLLLVLVLGATAYWFFYGKKSTNTLSGEERNFTIDDTASIDRIFFAKKTGASILLERNADGSWKLNGKDEARIDAVDLLLETFKRLAVKSPVPVNGMETVKRNLVVDGLKVEVYQKGEKVKTMYMGTPTKDFRGTYMMMEDAQMAYIMHLPGWEGTVTPRFFIDPIDWKSRVIFRAAPKQLQEVVVQYPTHPEDNFILTKSAKGAYQLQGNKLSLLADTALMNLYSTYFNGVHCEGFEPNNPNRDSVMKTTPIFIISLINEKNIKTSVKFWPFFINMNNTVGPQDEQTGKLNDVERVFFYREETKDFGVMQLLSIQGMIKRYKDFGRRSLTTHSN